MWVIKVPLPYAIVMAPVLSKSTSFDSRFSLPDGTLPDIPML